MDQTREQRKAKQPEEQAAKQMENDQAVDQEQENQTREGWFQKWKGWFQKWLHRGKKEDMPDTEPDSREAKRQQEKQQKKRYRLRLMPVWLRVVVLLLLCIFALVVGTMIGFGVIGGGQAFDVFHKETWQHIYDVIYKD